MFCDFTCFLLLLLIAEVTLADDPLCTQRIQQYGASYYCSMYSPRCPTACGVPPGQSNYCPSDPPNCGQMIQIYGAAYYCSYYSSICQSSCKPSCSGVTWAFIRYWALSFWDSKAWKSIDFGDIQSTVKCWFSAAFWALTWFGRFLQKILKIQIKAHTKISAQRRLFGQRFLEIFLLSNRLFSVFYYCIDVGKQ